MDEKIYLSPRLDLFNEEIVSYSISGSPNMERVTEMPDKAFDKVKDTKGLILHSDQGGNISTVDTGSLYRNIELSEVCPEKGTGWTMP